MYQISMKTMNIYIGSNSKAMTGIVCRIDIEYSISNKYGQISILC